MVGGGDERGALLPLVEELYQQLQARGRTLATAESCTGGLLGATLVAFPNISEVYVGGVIVYSNEAKETLLGVEHELLLAIGAVSPEVGKKMAEQVRAKLGATYGVGITGIAGPSGGTGEKPVGLVYVGYAQPESTEVVEYRFTGERRHIQWQTVEAVLNHLLKVLSSFRR